MAAGTLLLSAALIRAVAIGTVTAEDFRPAPTQTNADAESRSRANVYVLLLDGYPRDDSLRESFGFDNGPFLRRLEALGFKINRDAETTYARTELTLSSLVLPDSKMLRSYAYGEGNETAALRRAVRREHLVNSPVMDDLRALGYRLVYIPPPVTFAIWQGWDERVELGYPNDYESVVIQRTALRFLLGGWLLDQGRAQVDATLARWSSGTGQRFTFAHVMAPHPPFAWTSGGLVDHPLPCWYEVQCSLFNGFPRNLALSEEEFAEKVGPQVAAINERVLLATERIVDRDPTAIVVIFSDHGTRYRDMQSPEAHRTLFAARGTNATEADGLFAVLRNQLRDDYEN
jgi:hypothetical protein